MATHICYLTKSGIADQNELDDAARQQAERDPQYPSPDAWTWREVPARTVNLGFDAPEGLRVYEGTVEV